jgi:hypothetical protein
MKTLIQLVIVAMFGIEICSPFFLGYLNSKQKIKQNYTARETASKINVIEEIASVDKEVKSWKVVDFSENNYSDSKALQIKE